MKMAHPIQPRTNWTMPPTTAVSPDLSGLWHAIHETAMMGDAFPFKRWMTYQIDHLPCERCRRHAQTYVKKHPISGDPVEWAWRFHNNVNTRLGKPTMTLENCVKLYRDGASCKTCGA